MNCWAVASDKLADVLFIQVIRHHLSHHKSSKGVLGALSEKPLHNALKLIYEDPFAAWDLVSLARKVGLSRSVFTSRFKSKIGDTPMNYLLMWRMHKTFLWFKDERMTVPEVAARCGY